MSREIFGKKSSERISEIQRSLIPSRLKSEDSLVLKATPYTFRREKIIQETEKVLGFLLPSGYRWFLKNFQWAYLNNMPIFGLHDLFELDDSENYFLNRSNFYERSDLLLEHASRLMREEPSEQLVFYKDIWDRSYYFNITPFSLRREAVFISDQGETKRAAKNFYDFLCNQTEHSANQGLKARWRPLRKCFKH